MEHLGITVDQWEAEEELREQEHYEDLCQYVKSPTKAGLQEQLLDALVQLEERRNYLLLLPAGG